MESQQHLGSCLKSGIYFRAIGIRRCFPEMAPWSKFNFYWKKAFFKTVIIELWIESKCKQLQLSFSCCYLNRKKKIPFSSSYTLGLGMSKCSHKHPSFPWDKKSGCKESDTALVHRLLCGDQEPEIPGANCILYRCLTRQHRSLEQSPKSSETATDRGARLLFTEEPNAFRTAWVQYRACNQKSFIYFFVLLCWGRDAIFLCMLLQHSHLLKLCLCSFLEFVMDSNCASNSKIALS